MKFKNIIILSLIILAGAFLSCEEVIEIDLNEAEPALIIEGEVNNIESVFRVKVSKSRNYYTSDEAEKVNDAKVSIRDSQGISEDLVRVSDGVYETSNITGVPGRTYYLRVEYQNKVYEAESYMPELVKLNSIGYEFTEIGFFQKEDGFEVTSYFTDPEEEGNYYRLRIFQNDELVKDSYNLYWDNYGNNEEVEYTRYSGVEFEAGDKVQVHLMSITKHAYNYYQLLSGNVIGDETGGMSGDTPANPKSNLTNGALGYFGAYSISPSNTVVLKH